MLTGMVSGIQSVLVGAAMTSANDNKNIYVSVVLIPVFDYPQSINEAHIFSADILNIH